MAAAEKDPNKLVAEVQQRRPTRSKDNPERLEQKVVKKTFQAVASGQRDSGGFVDYSELSLAQQGKVRDLTFASLAITCSDTLFTLAESQPVPRTKTRRLPPCNRLKVQSPFPIAQIDPSRSSSDPISLCTPLRRCKLETKEDREKGYLFFDLSLEEALKTLPNRVN